jgi:hypothetical protein
MSQHLTEPLIHYRAQNGPQIIPILRQMNEMHVTPSLC